MILRNTIITLSLIISLGSANAQKRAEYKLHSTAFEKALIAYSSDDLPRDIQFIENTGINDKSFFSAYRKAFNLSPENEFQMLKSRTDLIGSEHSRHNQYYKGIELAEVQYILHSKKGQVQHSHGTIIHGLDLDITPNITVNEAAKYLKKHFGENAIFYSSSDSYEDAKTNASPLPIKTSNKPRLMISAGNKAKISSNFRLVYRFDVITLHPTGRYWVDIDANDGKLLGKIATAYTENIQTTGESLYNGTVEITVSDSAYVGEWELASNWHLDEWQAYGTTGVSWRMADPDLGDNGGYGNEWYDVLQTNSILLEGNNPSLSFYHRYALETPENYEEYDGWDGINVRVSTDGGESWQILQNPSIAYNCDSLFSFGFSHNEGFGIPGWGGLQLNWIPVTFDLSEYAGESLSIRFAFASDPGYSTSDGAPELFGWQLDNIVVSSSMGNLFVNNGSLEGMQMINEFRQATIIEGKYRLRETTRGGGIATLNGLDGENTGESVDYVENDLFFNEEMNKEGVGLHWAAEKTYDYYLEKHNRHSFDDDEGRIFVYSNWLFSIDGGTTQNNAMWAGNKAFFGAGDGSYYGSFGSLDITGHEISHGVTEYSAGLIYENEPGALNESFSDIFGTAIEFHIEQEEADWLIGEDSKILGPALRSMSSPHQHGDPDTYLGSYWVESTEEPASENDYGGVHTNSGVQNYWFYLLSEGGNGTNDDGFAYDVSGIGIENAAAIAYRNLTTYLNPVSDFQQAAFYSIQSASDLFGNQSSQHKETIDAWEAVGIYQHPSIKAPEYINVHTDPWSSTSTNVEIRNKGLQALTISSITIEGIGFSLDQIISPPFEVAFDQSLKFSFSFTANKKTEKQGKITINSDDPDQAVYEILLFGSSMLVLDIGDSPKHENTSLKLLPNYPNPFTTSTVIPFILPEASNVNITIFNAMGEEIYRFEEDYLAAGEHAVEWNAQTNSGNDLMPGVYIAVLQTAYGRASKVLSLY